MGFLGRQTGVNLAPVSEEYLHYPWSEEALAMINAIDIRYRAELIRDAECCAKCMGETSVTPLAIREARCSHLDE